MRLSIGDTVFFLPRERSQWLPPLVLSIILILLYFFPVSFAMWLVFSREALPDQFWRFITAHLVHLRLPHLITNMSGIWFIWLLFAEHLEGYRYLVVSMYLMGVVGGAMYLFAPDILFYNGLSAVLYGLLVYGAWCEMKRSSTFALTVLVLVSAKAVWDHYALPDSGDYIVATAAHSFGIVAASILYGIQRINSRLSNV